MRQLPVHELAALLASLEAGAKPVILDVREPWEVQTAALRIEGVPTLYIPMNEVPGRLAELSPDQPVLSLCHHGMRSLQVAAFLERQGFEQVYNIQGGIDAWARQVDGSIPLY